MLDGGPGDTGWQVPGSPSPAHQGCTRLPRMLTGLKGQRPSRPGGKGPPRVPGGTGLAFKGGGCAKALRELKTQAPRRE